MTEIISVTDLPASLQSVELVGAMVAGANAKASRVAPCLTWTGGEDSDEPAPSEDQLAEALLVLVGAVKRWAEAGSGAVQSQTAGPFGLTVDTRQRTGFNLWPSEIRDLQDICKRNDAKRAFAVDTVGCGGGHSPICSLYFGGSACSCGADIAGTAIYEGCW